jgi:hypothetical protein
MDPTQEEKKLAEFLIGNVVSKASGRADDECVGNYPHDRYFIGNLRPTFSDQTVIDSRFSHEQTARLSPVAFGGEFKFSSRSNEFLIKIKLSWNLYYRVFPSYTEQYQYQFQEKIIQEDPESPEIPEDEENDIVTKIDNPSTRTTDPLHREKIKLRFKKISCLAHGNINIIKNDGKWIIDYSNFEISVKDEVQKAITIISTDPLRIKTKKDDTKNVIISDKDLETEEDYASFIRLLSIEILPAWKWEFNFSFREEYRKDQIITYFLAFEFSNNSSIDPKSVNLEGYFFDPISFFVLSDNERLLPFEVDLEKKGFRYNQEIWGKGFNCALEKVSPSIIQTNSTPKYYQKRYRTKQSPKATFQDLSTHPIPTLEKILVEMKKYQNEWDLEEKKYKQKFVNWDENYKQGYFKDYAIYLSEINRFEEGVNLIKNDPDILLAFKLTNEAFYRSGKLSTPEKVEWRLFQIVFLVCQLSEIAVLKNLELDQNKRKYVDIIYFPTGGGKTEAYLSVLIFHCFFDRLRGKQAGCTAWLRFSLRLLTLQQTQRITDLIGIAELLRKEQTDPRLNSTLIDKFAVGYFVGELSTPNKLVPPSHNDDPNPDWIIANSPELRQQWKRIIKCPSCGTKSIVVDFDPKNVRIIHRCQNMNCHFENGEVPIYIIDNEIFRYLPSIIVGTLDKLASLGNQRKVSLILGKVDGKCKIHGYYGGTVCTQEKCDNRNLTPQIPKGISGPTVFVQDELHLIKESLGTFDSHYETFAQQLLDEFGNKSPLKIIASSATIESFERQVEHLYGREKKYARIFPGSGPTLESSFYAEIIDETQRIFLGVIPHNKTILRGYIEFIEYYQKGIEDLYRIPNTSQNPYGGNFQPQSNEWFTLLDLYSTSLFYFQKKDTLDSLGTEIKNFINTELAVSGYSRLNFAELAGGTSTDAVASILEKLETPRQRNGDDIDAVLATSMVSHGVDINRLNTMLFFGMPRLNAEYIQASSRVGRMHVGIVFDFFAPIKERDQSYYSYFYKYHEFLGQLIEPVAINRWSKFGIRRTLPGLFMGIILQIIANNQHSVKPTKYYMLDFIKNKLSSGEISPDDFLTILEKSYLPEGNYDTERKEFIRSEIRRLVDHYIDLIHNASTTNNTFVSEALIPPPMMNLRDVDEKIEIDLDPNGWQWGRGR